MSKELEQVKKALQEAVVYIPTHDSCSSFCKTTDTSNAYCRNCYQNFASGDVKQALTALEAYEARLESEEFEQNLAQAIIKTIKG